MASHETDMSGARWHKSTYSNGDGGDCVEVATNLARVVPVRDTKRGATGPVLRVGPAAWTAFVTATTTPGDRQPPAPTV
ncbi:DUF397 domain-containing protein [Streptomyces sp. SID5785]|uniref:DUF397 domain-containing protein n=1 Tax=Streptomyces sp. SID5785 TaxID=2690309 RepID=UPI001360EBD9|nr:DUF397 domain-containing protein [Streptomyces sp. SID5785]MZD04856.1 DUF397 domain-containing protein [Streptomyces sp. SID5785]